MVCNYKFVVREKTIEEFEWRNGELRISKNKAIFIAVKDTVRKITLPHPLTSYVIAKYDNEGYSQSHQKNAAYAVVRFLNYINLEIDNNNHRFNSLKDLGLKGLQRKHFSSYITYRTSLKLKYSTVSYDKTYLETFYEFLQEQKLIDEKYEIKYIVGRNKQIKRLPIFNSPHLNTKFPKKDYEPLNKLKDFGRNRKHLVPEFINAVRESCPDIALAVCLQIYGGLRLGEVLNLIKGSVEQQSDGILHVKIKDRQNTLFPHLASHQGLQVKRPRNQQILPSSLVKAVYEQHLKRNESHVSKHKNKYALFVNSDFLPLSKDDYYSRFTKAKNYFLEKLLSNNRYEDYLLLQNYRWSTHIGRGIYTNFLIDMHLSVTQIALARGDRNIMSALSYVDEKHTIEKIRGYINEFAKLEQDSLGEIKNIERFRDNVSNGNK